MDDQSSNRQYARDAAPTAWADYADELKESADVLWHHHLEKLVVSSDVNSHVTQKPSVSRSYILLAGFALENLFKGLVVVCDPSLVRGGRLSGALKSHRLTRLAELAAETLEDDEARFCVLAEEAIPYWARYPVPLSVDAIREEVPLSAMHHAAFERLFARGRRRLYALCKRGWDSGEGIRLTSHFDSRFDGDSH